MPQTHTTTGARTTAQADTHAQEGTVITRAYVAVWVRGEVCGPRHVGYG